MNDSASSIVHVAVAVLFNHKGDVLLAKRANHQHQGGLWEFPGGKVECDETVFEALVRECLEEIDVTILGADPLMEVTHDYGDKNVVLDVWQSRTFSGKAKGNEGQKVRWVPIIELTYYDFPKANQAIIQKLLANQ